MADKVYHYLGAIKRFGKVVKMGWEAETTASSPVKALNNLKYKARKFLRLTPNTKVELDPRNMICIEDIDEEETKEYNRSYDPDYDIPDDWEGDYEEPESMKIKEDHTSKDLEDNFCTLIPGVPKLKRASKEFNQRDAKFKDEDDDVYDVYYEDRNTHKRGSFKRRTWNQVERLMNNKNLRIISVSPSEDENKQYSIDFYYNIYYVDMDNTYEEEKKALKEDYLPRYNLKLIEFAEIHDGGPDNCRITLKGTRSDLEKFIYDMDENPEDYKFRARDTKFNDVEPRKGEKKDDFISRFMSATKKEYPDYKQRLSVAYSYWNRAKGIKD